MACGARTRNGGTRRKAPLPGGTRCRMHGGMPKGLVPPAGQSTCVAPCRSPASLVSVVGTVVTGDCLGAGARYISSLWRTVPRATTHAAAGRAVGRLRRVVPSSCESSRRAQRPREGFVDRLGPAGRAGPRSRHISGRHASRGDIPGCISSRCETVGWIFSAAGSDVGILCGVQSDMWHRTPHRLVLCRRWRQVVSLGLTDPRPPSLRRS